jgi:hypothetical protein
MLLKLSTTDRTALAAALRDQWDNQPGACTLDIYSGTPIETPGTAVTTQVRLGTLTCADPIGSAASGALTFGSITQDDAADATGTAAWALLRDGSGAGRAVVDVTDTAGNGFLKLNTTSIIVNGPIRVTSFVITIGGA